MMVEMSDDDDQMMVEMSDDDDQMMVEMSDNDDQMMMEMSDDDEDDCGNDDGENMNCRMKMHEDKTGNMTHEMTENIKWLKHKKDAWHRMTVWLYDCVTWHMKWCLT